MIYPDDFISRIICGDCLSYLPQISSESIDLILCDLPYGVTSRNSWDNIIPLEPLWKEYRRIIKPNGAIVLTAMGVFSAKLILAAEDIYKYSLVWKKNKPRGHLNAKKQPLRVHEDILVFYKNQPTYNPQMTSGHFPVHNYSKHSDNSHNYGKVKNVSGGGSTERYPVSVIEISVVNNEDKDKIHPTQKPVELGTYIIRTFTNPGDLVLDNACGSGSFLVAAKNNNRKYIGIELDQDYVKFSDKRLKCSCDIFS